MKFDALCALAHNLADSLGSGASLVFNAWDLDVFKEAAATPAQCLEIDFLAGKVVGGGGSADLQAVVAKSDVALASLCQSHGTSPAAFRQLRVRYVAGAKGKRFLVTVENDQGRIRTDEYAGFPGRRVKSGKHPHVSSLI